MKRRFIKNINRRYTIRTYTYLAALVVVIGVFSWSTSTKISRYELYIENGYQHAFTELVTAVESIDVDLQKVLMTNSPALLSSISTDIFGKANAAAMSLGELPFSTIELKRTAGFVTKVGDYALALSRKAALGEVGSEEELSILKELSDTATVLAQNLTELQNDIYKGSLNIGELVEAEQKLNSDEKSEIKKSVSDGVSSIESEFPEVPTLIYDGPFSEHIEDKNPVMLEGKDVVPAEEVKTKAAEFFGLRGEAFEDAGSGDGKVKTYSFSARVDGGEMYVEATQVGGFISSMINSRSVSEAKISAEVAVEKAAEFLKSHGFESMHRSYYEIRNNVLTANFAYEQDGVICYPDLIKVSVAMDNGRIVGYEAAGYIANHMKREIPEAAVTKEAAAEKLSSGLTVLSHSMAIIPSMGKNELFCHEFKCETEDEKHYILYVDAKTGNEQKILILLEDETGTLTI